MPWNPETYNQFKEIRFQPFFDLVNLVADNNLQHAVDIGCGTGEQTAILADKFEHTNFSGIDSSQEMLAKATPLENERLHFTVTTIEEFISSSSNQDLIFSNAALQWVENHETLFPKLISMLNKGGQLAVQMPFQHENSLNKILWEIVGEKKFSDALKGFARVSPVLQIDDYAKILFAEGLKDITLFLKVYPIIAKTETDLYNFIAGSALIPYMERLNSEEQESFRSEYIKRIRDQFAPFPAIYSFKRILMHGTKG